MKLEIKHAYTLSIVAALAAMTSGAFRIKAQQAGNTVATFGTVTLLAQAKHDDFKIATVNFAIGVRGDSKDPPTRNEYDLRYGGRLDRDMDWFDVPLGEDSRSQVRDLGGLGWSDIYEVPILLTSPTPHNEGETEIFRAGKMNQHLPEGTLVKAVLGHMYVLHSKHDKIDLYVLFRVEEIKPSDECTISWKVVPSPEAK